MPKRTQFLTCPLCGHNEGYDETNKRSKNDGTIQIRTYRCFHCNFEFLAIEKVLLPIKPKERYARVKKRIDEINKVKNFRDGLWDINSRLGNTRETDIWIKHTIKEMTKMGLKKDKEVIEKLKDDGWESPEEEIVVEKAFKTKKKG